MTWTGPTPPPRGGRKAAVILVVIVVFVALTAFLYGRRPSFVIDKAWYISSNSTVYIDLKNTGGIAHKVGVDASPGELSLSSKYLQLKPDIMPGYTYHVSIGNAEKSDVTSVHVEYDEGSCSFMIPWSHPDDKSEETLTNINPEV